MMYIPDKYWLYEITPEFDPVTGRYSFTPVAYSNKIDSILFPDSGYIITPDFRIVYDVLKVDDGTLTGNNDAQILLINAMLWYFAIHDRNWYKIINLLNGTFYHPNFPATFQSNNLSVIIPPPVSLFDCNRKLFSVGTRHIPAFGMHNTDFSLCLSVYALYYNATPEPIDQNGIVVSPKTINDVTAKFRLRTCEEWFYNQFTLAIGDWQSVTSSGWYNSNNLPLISRDKLSLVWRE